MRDIRSVVTVDGLAGSGKTTLSRELARVLGYRHLNSGLLYRAVGWLVAQAGADPDDAQSVAGVLSGHQLELREEGTVHLDGAPLAGDMQLPQVSDYASRVAVHEPVRRVLLPVQRSAFPGHGIVAEGRDMGTIIFPDAAIKFFVVADEATRVHRRSSQLGASGRTSEQQIEDIRLEIRDRDVRDSQRALAPTVAAAGAVQVDNSGRSIDEIVAEMRAVVVSKC